MTLHHSYSPRLLSCKCRMCMTCLANINVCTAPVSFRPWSCSTARDRLSSPKWNTSTYLQHCSHWKGCSDLFILHLSWMVFIDLAAASCWHSSGQWGGGLMQVCSYCLSHCHVGAGSNPHWLTKMSWHPVVRKTITQSESPGSFRGVVYGMVKWEWTVRTV